MGIPAIVLAAGASTRLGQPKQLVPYQGETLLARAIRLAREAGADPVFVVLGAHHQSMVPHVQAARGLPMINDRWQQGIASSIQAGLRALESAFPEASAVLLLTCDQPRLTAAHLASLLNAFEGNPQPVTVASAYEGVLGTPAVFPRSAFPLLYSLQGDKGARALLTQSSCPLIELPFPGGEIDIDTPADLNQLS